MNEPSKLTPDMELLDLMRKKELREAMEFERQQEERRSAKENYELRKHRQSVNDSQVFEAAASWQARCDHRKGTRGKKKWRHVDFDVSLHVFPNGLGRVKCNKCRFMAFPGDTEKMCSYTHANFQAGKKVPNPSRLSYAKWLDMTLEENTTNTSTRSEMITKGPEPVTA